MNVEKSKNIFENSKNGTIGARIAVLLDQKKVSVSKLESDGGVGNGTLKTWKDENVDYSTNTVETFLKNLRINRHWWMTGEGDIFAKDESNSSLDKDAIYRDLVESNSDYRLVPKTILDEEYRIVLKSQIEREEKVLEILLEAKDKLISRLENEIAELRRSGVVLDSKKA